MMNMVIILLAIIWLTYKLIITKEMKFLVIAVLLALIELTREPFAINRLLICGILSLSGGTLLSIEYLLNKKLNSIAPYILIFLTIGGALIFLFFSGKCS